MYINEKYAVNAKLLRFPNANFSLKEQNMPEDTNKDSDRHSTHVFSNQELEQIKEASKRSDTKIFSNDEVEKIKEASKKPQ